jgi:hypothetical protein
MRERYMVNHQMWDEVTYEEGHAHMLCIGCLEARIGRRLWHGDFINCPLNYGDLREHSQRLAHRLTAALAA